MTKARFPKATGVWTSAIGAFLLSVVAIPAQTTTLPVENANDGYISNFNPALNAPRIGGCLLYEEFDFVTPPTLPPGWIAINGINPDGILWQTSNSGNPTPPAHSLPNAGWVNDPDTISDKYLDSPSGPIDPNASAALSFWQNYALEDGFDGGVLEISIDGGPFQDILAAGGFFLVGGYNGTISTCCGNPLGGRQAWTGDSGGFIQTWVELPFKGHTIALRWRMASDSSGSGQGWRVDDVYIVCEAPTPTPTMPPPTPTSSPTATATATPTPPITPSPTATTTPTATITPRVTPTPRITPTPRSRPTPRPRP